MAGGRTRTDPQNTPVEVKRTHSSAAIETRILAGAVIMAKD